MGAKALPESAAARFAQFKGAFTRPSKAGLERRFSSAADNVVHDIKAGRADVHELKVRLASALHHEANQLATDNALDFAGVRDDGARKKVHEGMLALAEHLDGHDLSEELHLNPEAVRLRNAASAPLGRLKSRLFNFYHLHRYNFLRSMFRDLYVERRQGLYRQLQGQPSQPQHSEVTSR